MGRAKLTMKLIEKEKSRKATFYKRKNGIIKKAHELSTLCGVDSCFIVFNPNSDDHCPETWPRDSKEVHRIIKKYEIKSIEKRPKKYDVVEFFKDRKNKVEAEAFKRQKERLKILYPTWDISFDILREDQLRMFLTFLDVKIEDCMQRINVLKTKHHLKEKGAESSDIASSSSQVISFMQKSTSQPQDFSMPYQMMLPLDPNLMHLMVTQNATPGSNSALGFYDPMDHGGGASNYADPSASSPCYYNCNYYPSLQKLPAQVNVMQHHHEVNLQAPHLR